MGGCEGRGREQVSGFRAQGCDVVFEVKLGLVALSGHEFSMWGVGT